MYWHGHVVYMKIKVVPHKEIMEGEDIQITSVFK